MSVQVVSKGQAELEALKEASARLRLRLEQQLEGVLSPEQSRYAIEALIERLVEKQYA
jgi:hypothetical protein